MSFQHQKILVVLPARLGDTIFCTPAIHFLQQKFPHLQMDALVLTPLAADVLTNNPAIQQVFIAPEKEECERLAAQYSLVLWLHHDPKTIAYLPWFKKVECWVIPEYKAEMQIHPSEQKLRFLQEKLNAQRSPESEHFFLYPQVQDHERIATLLKSRGLDLKHDYLIACHLGCHGLSKRGLRFWRRLEHRKAWALDNYIHLVRQLHALDPQIRVILTGTKNEISLGKKLIRKEKRCIDLINTTSVQEMAALMPHLKIFITGDTGPLHVACSTGVNLVVLYGADVIPQILPFPRRTNHTLIHAPTVAEISVDEVYRAVAHIAKQ